MVLAKTLGSWINRKESDILTSLWPGRTWQLLTQIHFSGLWFGTCVTNCFHKTDKGQKQRERKCHKHGHRPSHTVINNLNSLVESKNETQLNVTMYHKTQELISTLNSRAQVYCSADYQLSFIWYPFHLVQTLGYVCTLLTALPPATWNSQ